MVRKSTHPRKALVSPEPSWVSPHEHFSVSVEQWAQIEKKAKVNLSERIKSNLLYALDSFCRASAATRESPSVKDVRAKLEKWRRLSDELAKEMTNDESAIWKTSTRRLNDFFFESPENEKLWDEAGGYLNNCSEIKNQLASFVAGCEGALSKLDGQIAQDSGGISGEIERSELLRALLRLYSHANGIDLYREVFIRAVIDLMPKQKRPKLPEGKGELLKIIGRYNARYVVNKG